MAFSYRTTYDNDGIVVTRLEIPMLDAEYAAVAKQAVLSMAGVTNYQKLVSYLDVILFDSPESKNGVPEQMLSDLDEARDGMCQSISNSIIALVTLADIWGLDIQADMNARIFDRL